MNPADNHVVTATAIKAKTAQDAGASLHARPPSQASRIGAIVVWLLALGSMIALFMLR